MAQLSVARDLAQPRRVVEADFSDAQVAEIFLHHRVLILPVVDDRQVVGVITRGDVFRALDDRFLATE